MQVQNSLLYCEMDWKAGPLKGKAPSGKKSSQDTSTEFSGKVEG